MTSGESEPTPGDDNESLAEHVWDHFEDPYHQGDCATATHRAVRENPMCSDWVRIDLAVGRSGEVDEAWFTAAGCPLSQAAASMLVEHVEGLRFDRVRDLSASDVLGWFDGSVSIARQKCALLAWRALQSAIVSPVAYDETETDDGEGPPRFGGPSLDEET